VQTKAKQRWIFCHPTRKKELTIKDKCIPPPQKEATPKKKNRSPPKKVEAPQKKNSTSSSSLNLKEVIYQSSTVAIAPSVAP